jgi:hypothetical protein
MALACKHNGMKQQKEDVTEKIEGLRAGRKEKPGRPPRESEEFFNVL